jgi:hypothetical protein
MNAATVTTTTTIQKLILVITGATEPISKSLRQYLSKITGQHKIKEMQKSVILSTAHKLRQVLM